MPPVPSDTRDADVQPSGLQLGSLADTVHACHGIQDNQFSSSHSLTSCGREVASRDISRAEQYEAAFLEYGTIGLDVHEVAGTKTHRTRRDRPDRGQG